MTAKPRMDQPSFMRYVIPAAGLLCLLVVTSSAVGADDPVAEPARKSAEAAPVPTKEQLEFFENRIRPVLADSCYECHSARAVANNKLKGQLLLDSREAIRKGGESGPAVVPGQPAESLLIGALRHDSFKMPPNGKLPEAVIADFVTWIESGAADPREAPALVTASQIDIEAGRTHWAFQPLTPVEPPQVVDQAWGRGPVDRFVRARQEAAGVEPNAVASPHTLVRRAYYDLIGLPPSPEEVDQFVDEARQDLGSAYAKLVDRLLASEHYGERWARHWLDVARFAESNGYAFDLDRPNAWHYRDFVIRALNADLPYDQFVRQQIAGDILTDVNVQTSDDARLAVDRIAATGFLMAGPFTSQQTQKERERSRYEQLDDMINTLGTSLLGLTVGCCRCHDHKFDPLPQSDYYRLASCFAEVGSSDTGINMQPEAYQRDKAAYDAVHAPLLEARTQFEQQALGERLTAWLKDRPAEQPASQLTLQAWHHVGPFPAADMNAAFEQAFEPEAKVQLDATYQDGTLKWTEQKAWTDGAVHNTLSGDNAANYLFRVVESPVEQMVALSLGSDDAIKVWVNGQPVLANLVGRGAAADQERVQVGLKSGRNEILMKIVNGGGPSGFYFTAMPLVAEPLPTIGNWQHIGPFVAGDFNAAFDRVFPPEETTDLAQTYEDGKLKWTEQPSWKDGEAHNDKLQGNNCANYLVRVIESERPRVLSLSLGSDDGIKLWVNGREVLAKKVGRNVAAAGQETVTIQLAAGRNELLMKIVNGGGATGFYFSASSAPAPAEIQAILDLAEDKWNPAQRQKIVDWYQGFDADWLRLNQAVARHQLSEPKPKLTQVFAARVRGSTYQFGPDTYKVYHLRRGNADNKEQPAEPGFLRVLTAPEVDQQHWLGASDQEGKSLALSPRVALADWLTDTEDGAGQLLARVLVNRLWLHHFGRGIVATPSDFGTRGEKPSHPELLDWLAAELIRGGWQLKPIHKLIMTSAAYMQGGDVTDSGRRLDPDNVLVWRRPSRRLEAESIRDALLSVSGTLDRTLYGKGTLDERSNRRSIYFTVKRSQLPRMLQLFDVPDTMQGVGAREQSTVAPQALALLNSPTVRELAVKFAGQVRPDAAISLEEAVKRGYRIALSREVRDDELQAMTEFIRQQAQARGGDAAAESLALRDFCHLMLCTNEFVFVD